MLSSVLRACALVRLAALVAAASNDTINEGPSAADVSSDIWSSVAQNPNATSNATFTGYDLSKAFPSSEQEGWEVSIAIKKDLKAPDSDDKLIATTISIMAPDGGADKVDDSWTVCLHVFTVHTESASSWGSGETPSCNGLVAIECLQDLQSNAVKKFGEGCPSYSTTPSCLRDLDDQKSVSLAVTSSSAEHVFGNSSFYHMVDGIVAADAEDALYATSSMQPYAVISVFGSTSSTDGKAQAVAACVMPAATPASSAGVVSVAFMGWSVISAAAAFALLL